MKKISLLILFVFLANISCQSFTYGPPKSTYGAGLTSHASYEKSDVDLSDEPEKDPLGEGLIIGLAVAVGIGAAVLLPLYLDHKL